MIERLVGFDTTSHKSNLALIDFVADYLAGHGVVTARTFDDDRRKANLFATLGPGGAGGVVLSGHSDVVPVEGQPWDTEPFRVVEKDGRLYGRGTADMKSFLAIALAFVPEFLRRGLAVPVHLALSYDEEIGCLGAGRMIDKVVEAGLDPAVVIVGEPTGMHVVNAHKGTRAFTTTVTGHEAHSSATQRGVNAVMAAAELIRYLATLGDEMKARADAESGFDPPFTSVHVGPIEGGTALNIIPRRCVFQWEYRSMPEEDTDEIIERFNAFAATLEPPMQAIAAGCGIETVADCRVIGLEPEDASPAERLVMALTGDNRAAKVSFGTEAGLFQKAGMSAVICGPGDIAQAHKPNEFIELSQVEACVAFMRRLIDRLAQPL
ncbi:MAG: acetylornithine deacetylase [Proteobacteria bacterium]|nr:acetylornithine deacetylase [Pseudomonadota bacterium]